jgi:hypothetical protein
MLNESSERWEQNGKITAPYCTLAYTFALRETREGWPLLTVETEVNGDSKQIKGVFLGSFAGIFVPVQETFTLPWLLRSAHY